jgi:hypothetical protein
MSHKSKATSGVSYNLDDPPKAYSNPSIHTRISQYTSAASSVHGLEYDLSTEDFDAEIVMRVGGGKNHGRYWLGDGIIDSTFTPLSPRSEHGA